MLPKKCNSPRERATEKISQSVQDAKENADEKNDEFKERHIQVMRHGFEAAARDVRFSF